MQPHLSFAIFLFFSFSFQIVQANAAKVSLRNNAIYIEGQIEKGDLEKVRAVGPSEPYISSNDDGSGGPRVVLSSEGGDFAEGMRLAAYFKEFGLPTLIERGHNCLSACAFAFLGGYDRWYEGQFTSRTMEIGAVLKFHAPFVPDNVSQDASKSKIDIAKLYRLTTTQNIRLAQELSEYEVPNWLVPFLLRNEEDHSFFSVDNVEKAYALKVTVFGADASKRWLGKSLLSKPMAVNSCLAAINIRFGFPSASRAEDLKEIASSIGEAKVAEDGLYILFGLMERMEIIQCNMRPYAFCEVRILDNEVSCGEGNNSALVLVAPTTKLEDFENELQKLENSAPPIFPHLTKEVAKVSEKPKSSGAKICNRKFPVTNLRSGPGAKNYSIVAELSNGLEISVLGEVLNPDSGHKWYRVDVNGKSGFVDADLVAESCDVALPQNVQGQEAVVCNREASITNMRTGPNPKIFEVSAVLNNRQPILVLAKTTNTVSGHLWYQVSYKGKTGYIDSEKVAKTCDP